MAKPATSPAATVNVALIVESTTVSAASARTATRQVPNARAILLEAHERLDQSVLRAGRQLGGWPPNA